MPPALEGWDFTHEEYARMLPWKEPKDEAVREALALLSAAGYSKEQPLKFEVTSTTSIFLQALAQLVQAHWRQLGQGFVDTEFKYHDSATANRIRSQRTHEYLVHGVQSSMPEPDAQLSEFYRTGGPTNFMNVSDPQLDSMIDRQRTIFNAEQRKAAVKEIVRYWTEKGPGMGVGLRWYLSGTKPTLRDHAAEFYMFGTQYDQVWVDA
jgi:peptide/nickel transport system substrate-binding protein